MGGFCQCGWTKQQNKRIASKLESFSSVLHKINISLEIQSLPNFLLQKRFYAANVMKKRQFSFKIQKMRANSFNCSKKFLAG